MHFKFNDLDMDTPKILYDDVYVFSRGRCIFSRTSSGRVISDLSFLIGAREYSFVRGKLLGFATRPLLMVDSLLGVPVLIDRSLAPKYGILTVSVPSFTREEVLSLALGELRSLILPSESIAESLSGVSLEIREDLSAYASRYGALFDEWRFFAPEFATNNSIAALISEMARAYSELLGCGVSVEYGELREMDLANAFSPQIFALSLVGALLMGRRYSSERRIGIKAVFTEQGIYADISFTLASEYGDAHLADVSKEYSDLKSVMDTGGVMHTGIQRGKDVILRVFLWQSRPDSSDLKEKNLRLIYDR